MISGCFSKPANDPPLAAKVAVGFNDNMLDNNPMHSRQPKKRYIRVKVMLCMVGHLPSNQMNPSVTQGRPSVLK